MQLLSWKRRMLSWINNMKKFFIITNKHKDENLELTDSIMEYIRGKGGVCNNFVSTKSSWSQHKLMDLCKTELNAECIIVLGGDGTLVRASRDLVSLGIPLVGVNLGTLGYLCELEKSTVFDAIDALFEDRYEIENRMIINGEYIIQGVPGKSGNALNDIVIHRTEIPQLINLVISVNGEYLTTYSADGIIIATPTGSTGYSMSAGGPIVDPKAELILITPINPHDFHSKSIVVGADAQIEIELAERRPERDEEAEVSFDGDLLGKLTVGNKICVEKSDENAKILKLNRVSFLQILRKKLQECP